MIKITIDLQYHRGEFDDWLAGGKVEYTGKTYFWSAQNSNYGFGWEIEPITEEDWANIREDKFDSILSLIESCLYQHQAEYIF